MAANDFVSPDAAVVYAARNNIVVDSSDPRTPAQLKALADARANDHDLHFFGGWTPVSLPLPRKAS